MTATVVTGSLRRRRWATVTVRLMLAQTAVLLAGLAAVFVTAALVGPAMFHRELLLAGHPDEATGLVHVEHAFRRVGLTAMIIGAMPGLCIAGVLSFYLHRTIGRSLRSFTAAAREVADSNYDVRVAVTGLGPEFDFLAASFNDMAHKLNAVDTTRRQMLADLAHEMRTPLASLKGHLEGIEDGVVEFDDRTQALLQAQITRLERLARDIRRLTQAEEGMIHLQPVEVDAEQLVAHAVAAIAQPAAAKDVRVSTSSTGADRTPVVMDPERTGQVLGNLLENALRHTDAGGHITVRTDHTPETIVFTVTDDGDGIPAEHLPHVFERFYRADPGREHDRRGSGLGLAISKALVEAQGGALEVTSPGPDQGTSFQVRLPRHAG